MTLEVPKEVHIGTSSHIQEPEWELPDSDLKHGPLHNSRMRAAKAAVGEKLHGAFGRERYFNIRRRNFLILVGVAFALLLALIIGLSVGLAKKGQKAQNLPLPTNSEAHLGDLTYYGTGLGACGITSTDADDIVAVSHLVFDAVSAGSNPNANPLCGRKIRARRFNENVGAERSVDLTVVDRCVGCLATDIDVSPTAFDKLAPRESGRVLVTWAWL